MKRTAIIAILLAFTCLIGGCNEKPCNSEGSIKSDGGTIYHCADRHDGGGLRWYPE